MIFDICLYKFCAGKLSQYPTLEYAKDVGSVPFHAGAQKYYNEAK